MRGRGHGGGVPSSRPGWWVSGGLPGPGWSGVLPGGARRDPVDRVGALFVLTHSESIARGVSRVTSWTRRGVRPARSNHWALCVSQGVMSGWDGWPRSEL